MRLLVVCASGAGHLNPLLPLVSEFVASGDHVLVASSADNGPGAEQAGAEFTSVGLGETSWFEKLRARIRGFPGDGLAPSRINHYFLPRLFAEIVAADMIDDVLDRGRRFGPDLVMFETYAFAGPLAAELLGVPGVNHLLSPMLPHEVMELVDDAVCPLWRSFGLDSPGYAGIYRNATIEISPPSLEPLRVPQGESVMLRPAPPPRPPTAEPGSGRPLVYVSLGTFFGQNTDVFRIVLEGLAQEPVDVLVTVGRDQDPGSLREVAANARVEQFIDQSEVMPNAAAVVHHGGSGTMFGALTHGLPQVVIPQGADNFANAASLALAGVASTLLPGDLTPNNVRDAVRRALDEPAYEAAGERLAAEIDTMPGPSDVAVVVRDIARRGARPS